MTVPTLSDPAEMMMLRSELVSAKEKSFLTNELDLTKLAVAFAAGDDSTNATNKKKPCIRRSSASIMGRRSSASSSTGKKRVRFARASTDDATECEPSVHTQVLCVLKPSSEMTTDEKSSVWWDVTDVAYFRGTAALISGEIRRRSQAAGGLPQAGKAPTYAQVVAHALEDCRRRQEAQEAEALNPDCEGSPLPKMVSAYLAHWAKQGHSRRGLERLSVEARAAAFRKHREACIRAVLSAQARTTAEERQGHSISHEEMTREASRRVTASARMYARAMGVADATAVGYKHYDEEDEVEVTRRKSERTEHMNVVSAAA